MSFLAESLFPVADLALSWLPERVRRLMLGRRSETLADLLVHAGRKGFLEYARKSGFRGKWTREELDLREDGLELARTLGATWLRMKERQRSVPPSFLPAPGWANTLSTEWAGPREWLENGDSAAFEVFLRNFFRNGGISGLWGSRGMFDNFVTESRWGDLGRIALFMRQFEAWRRDIPGSTLDELDAPRVGNPWGYDMDGRLVIEPAFEYHSIASRLRNLVADVEHPVVLEIGGGFGGQGHQILRQIPGVRYIGVDLPENVIIQSWYLKRSLPSLRVGVDEVNRANDEDLTEVDALLLPNWTLAELRLKRVDVVLNVRSFGEMSSSTLDGYFTEITRLRPEWVYHENLSSPRLDGRYGISSTEYPTLRGYRLVASCESRWPRYGHRSAYPCRENLLLTDQRRSRLNAARF